MGDPRVYLFSGLKIKQSSLFDFGEFYQRLFSWFEVMGYDFSEEGYERFDMGNFENVKIFWKASKEVENVKFVIEIGFFVIGLSKVELEKDGLKMKTNKGDLEMRMIAYFEKPDMSKKLGVTGQKLYEKFVIGEKLSDFETQLYEEAHMLIDEIKSFLSMHKV